jgi:hypothetical protein
MNATEILEELKKMYKSLIFVFCTFIIVFALVLGFIVYSFVHYLSLYDFTNDVDQYVKDVNESNIVQRSK